MTENEAIKELKDIHKQYVGGTEECEIIAGSITMSIKALEEIQQYRAIGTIEEFKDLKEKNEPKSRIIKNGKYYCCSCDRFARTSGHCSHCGQMLY